MLRRRATTQDPPPSREQLARADQIQNLMAEATAQANALQASLQQLGTVLESDLFGDTTPTEEHT
jgi:hypothetical protein